MCKFDLSLAKASLFSFVASLAEYGKNHTVIFDCMAYSMLVAPFSDNMDVNRPLIAANALHLHAEAFEMIWYQLSFLWPLLNDVLSIPG